MAYAGHQWCSIYEHSIDLSSRHIIHVYVFASQCMVNYLCGPSLKPHLCNGGVTTESLPKQEEDTERAVFSHLLLKCSGSTKLNQQHQTVSDG